MLDELWAATRCCRYWSTEYESKNGVISAWWMGIHAGDCTLPHIPNKQASQHLEKTVFHVA